MSWAVQRKATYPRKKVFKGTPWHIVRKMRLVAAAKAELIGDTATNTASTSRSKVSHNSPTHSISCKSKVQKTLIDVSKLNVALKSFQDHSCPGGK